VRATGQTRGAIGPFYIVISLIRSAINAAAGTGVIAYLVVPPINLGGVDPFDVWVSVSTFLGQDLIDNDRYTYGIRATSSQGQGAEIHGISVSYRF
jgi:hypothetical protein